MCTLCTHLKPFDRLQVEPAGPQKRLPGDPPLTKPVHGRSANGNHKTNDDHEDERFAWSLRAPTATGNNNQQKRETPTTAGGGQEKGSKEEKGAEQPPSSRDDRLPKTAASAESLPGIDRDAATRDAVGAAGSVGEPTRKAGAVWNAYQRGKWVNGQWVPKVGPPQNWYFHEFPISGFGTLLRLEPLPSEHLRSPRGPNVLPVLAASPCGIACYLLM